MLTRVLEVLFALSAGMVLYVYIGYPLVLLVLANLKQIGADIRFALGKRNRRQRNVGPTRPSVSLIFAAHNEQAVIDQKMKNCMELIYPADHLEILVGCDGCTDETVARARAAKLPHARILDFTDRSGKPGTLNRLVPMAQGEIIVFCDANTMFEPDTVTSLVRHFQMPEVGCVCGELRLVDASSKPSSEGMYWKYETLLKYLESRFNMLVGANGGVFAIRRHLFSPLPPDGIIDDFLVAMRIRAAGHRVVYDPEAVGTEQVAKQIRHEFRRRVRIGTGNFHALKHTWRLLNPRRGWIAFSYWSHKVFRWLVPLAMCVAEVCAILLSSNPAYAIWAGLGLYIFTTGLVGYWLDLRGRQWAPCSVPYYFMSMNLALLLGLIRFLFGSQSAIWKPTDRGTTAGAPGGAKFKRAHV